MRPKYTIRRGLIRWYPFYNKIRLANLILPSRKIKFDEISFLDADLLIQTKNDSYIEYLIYSCGSYEDEIAHLIKTFVSPGDTVLDVGANIGVHTLRLAKYTGKDGVVMAFEPIDDIYQRLTSNININHFKNVEVIKCALANTNEETEIHFHDDLFNKGITSLGMKERPNRKILVRKGDDVMSDKNVKKIDFIKIDVEGFEWGVIAGLQKTITRDRPKMIIEFNKYDSNLVHIITFLQGLHYTFYEIKERGLDRFEAISNLRNFGNLLCLPK